MNLKQTLQKLYTIVLGVLVVLVGGYVAYTEIYRKTDDDGFTRAEVATQRLGAEMAESSLDGYGDFKPLVAKDGALSWDIFAAVKEVEHQQPDPTDSKFNVYSLRPEFTSEIRALDGQKVRLMGYMFPLDPSEKQSNFLFGPYPPTCGFHYHVNNNQVIEVKAPKPIKFTWQPIAVEGVLTLFEKDKYNVFYQLSETKLLKTY